MAVAFFILLTALITFIGTVALISRFHLSIGIRTEFILYPVMLGVPGYCSMLFAVSLESALMMHFAGLGFFLLGLLCQNRIESFCVGLMMVVLTAFLIHAMNQKAERRQRKHMENPAATAPAR